MCVHIPTHVCLNEKERERGTGEYGVIRIKYEGRLVWQKLCTSGGQRNQVRTEP